MDSSQRDSIVSSMTLDEAKLQAQRVEDDVAAHIGGDSVVGSERVDPGTLLKCGRAEYQWSGGSSVFLAAHSPAAEVVDALGHFYAEQAADQSLVYETRMGRRAASDFVLRGDHGASYYVSAGVSDSSVEITSFSSCVRLDELPDGGLSY
jgi:hypothetical protein